MAYVDGFLIPVPKANLEQYWEMSRARRDEINDKAMKDPRMAQYMNPKALPFDGMRMIFGGYEMVIDL